jgi:hypothetical protein
MTPASFALIIGILYCGLGVLGFLPQAAPGGLLLGLFRTNAALSLLHLLTGLWGLAAWAWVARPVSYARGMTVIYGALALIGLLWEPLRGHDVWLHGLTALGAAYFGWFFGARPTTRLERRQNPAERRHARERVVQERRRNVEDRRLNQPATFPGG